MHMEWYSSWANINEHRECLPVMEKSAYNSRAGDTVLAEREPDVVPVHTPARIQPGSCVFRDSPLECDCYVEPRLRWHHPNEKHEKLP